MEIKKLNPLSKVEPKVEREEKPAKKGGTWKKVVLIVVGSLLLVGLTVAITLVAIGTIDVGKMASAVVTPVSKIFSGKEKVDSSEYWAVFLTSNQVYFGKLSDRDSQFLKLNDVFYLRAQRRLQPPEAEDEEIEDIIGSNTDKQQVQLIKLGDELHGPVDEIQFNRDNVLFLERLKNDSRVVRGIEQYNAGQ